MVVQMDPVMVVRVMQGLQVRQGLQAAMEITIQVAPDMQDLRVGLVNAVAMVMQVLLEQMVTELIRARQVVPHLILGLVNAVAMVMQVILEQMVTELIRARQVVPHLILGLVNAVAMVIQVIPEQTVMGQI